MRFNSIITTKCNNLGIYDITLSVIVMPSVSCIYKLTVWSFFISIPDTQLQKFGLNPKHKHICPCPYIWLHQSSITECLLVFSFKFIHKMPSYTVQQDGRWMDTTNLWWRKIIHFKFWQLCFLTFNWVVVGEPAEYLSVDIENMRLPQISNCPHGGHQAFSAHEQMWKTSFFSSWIVTWFPSTTGSSHFKFQTYLHQRCCWD